MGYFFKMLIRSIFAGTIGLVFLFSGYAYSKSGPQPWQMDFRPPATPVMEDIVYFHNFLLIIEVLIVLLVLGLMVYIVVKFNSKANPVPTKTTHNTALEVLWTVIPIIILVVISVPSIKLLYFMDKAPKDKVEMTLKVIGHQWYWSYEYPDAGDLAFDSNIIPDEEIDISKGHVRLLEVDNRVAVPVDTTIRVIVTSDDVLHNWAVPAFGIKMDTVPGRLNETWFRVPAEKAGVYRGQCSELCGVNHGYMPIVIEALPKPEFARWLKKAKKEFAENTESVNVASRRTLLQSQEQD